jgi:hypothetical protein
LQKISDAIQNLPKKADLPTDFGSYESIEKIYSNVMLIAQNICKLQLDNPFPSAQKNELREIYRDLVLSSVQLWIDHGIWHEQVAINLNSCTKTLIQANVFEDSDLNILIEEISKLTPKIQDLAFNFSNHELVKFEAVACLLEAHEELSKILVSSQVLDILSELFISGSKVALSLEYSCKHNGCISQHVDRAFDQIVRYSQIFNANQRIITKATQQEHGNLIESIISSNYERIKANTEYATSNNFDLSSCVQLCPLVKGVANYLESLGDSLAIKIPFADYPAVAEWFTMLVKYEALVYTKYLPQATKAGITLEKQKISEYLNQELQTEINNENLDRLKTLVTLSAHALAAEIELEPANLAQALEAILRAEISIATDCLKLLFDNNLLAEDICLSILIQSELFPAELLNHLLKVAPEKAILILEQRESPLSIYALEKILKKLVEVGDLISSNSKILERVEKLVLTEIEYFE